MILTLALDRASQARFDAERARYFPAERNYLDAHLTLFHQLRGSVEQIAPVLQEASQRARIPLEVTEVGLLGQATVAYRIAAPALNDLRDWLHPRLEHGGQDNRPFKPHVTVQNKVPVEVAEATAATLAEGFTPFEAVGTGLSLWHYKGGPWEAAGRFDFEETSK